MKGRSVLAVVFVLLAVFGAVASATPRIAALAADVAAPAFDADGLDHALLAAPSPQATPAAVVVDLVPPPPRELHAPRVPALLTAPKTSPPR